MSLDALLASARTASLQDPHDPRPCEAFIDALVACIGTDIPWRFALLLCNYQEINKSEPVNALVNRFLSRPLQQCLLVIESRAIPALELTPLVARREMLGLGSSSLHFTAQEIADLARLQGGEILSDKEAAQVAEAFDGWITGILLGTRLGTMQITPFAGSSGFWGSPAIQMEKQNLLAYLRHNVFRHNPAMYLFLQEVSILPRLTPTLCATLLDLPEASASLALLVQQGGFVTRCDEQSEDVYTCHPLLRELLSEELCKQNPERFALLHRRAADLFYARREYDQAISHALAAGADDRAAEIILEISAPLLARGDVERVARWIDSLPATTLTRFPRLLLARADIHLMLGEQVRALPLLEAVEEQLARQPDVILQAALLLAHGAACFQSGEYAKAQTLSEQVLALLPADEIELRARACLRLGVCANVSGNVAVGITRLQQALHLWEHNTEVHHTAQLHGMLANAYDMIGNYALSEHHRLRALRSWDHLHNDIGKINTLIGMGVTKHRQGAYDEAETVFQQALTLSRGSLNFQRGKAYALVSLGDLYQDQDKYEQALAMIENGLALARLLQDRYLTQYALCSLAMTYLLMGDPQTALLSLSDVQAEQDTYEGMVRELTRGAIFLHLQRYKEALACLAKLEVFLQRAGLKREQIQATIRMACLLPGPGTHNEIYSLPEEGCPADYAGGV